MKMRFWMLAIPFALSLLSALEGASPLPIAKQWDAEWIEVPGLRDGDYTVQYFRKAFELDSKPETLVVHVSGDSRYKLYVNGDLVSLGPAAGDYFHWNYESVDIAAWLNEGSNVLAALVWNEGEHRQESQISYRTGFVLQGEGDYAEAVNTNDSWRCLASEAYSPLPGIGYGTYYVCGPGERFDANAAPKGWMKPEFDQTNWKKGSRIGWPGRGSPKGSRDAAGWMLVPRSIPSMELTPQRFASIRSSSWEGISVRKLGAAIGAEIPANSEVTFLLDHGVLTNAYPILEFGGGVDSEITLVYNESLFEEHRQWRPHPKGNRNEVAGKVMLGRRDTVVSDGSLKQVHETLSWRTFRYVEVSIKTKDEPLWLKDISSVFVGYPFEFNATFESDRPEIAKMLEIGWRTARLCAVETYMDCPYYEQLQYIGDTRIQALVSLYNSGDDRLLRNALNLMDQSRIAEGITMSRHPSVTPQIISTFSLWYIGMLHDYWMYGSDPEFVREKLDGMRQILAFFSRYQIEDGSLRALPYWKYTDWMKEGQPGWSYGEAPVGESGESSPLDFQLLWAYQLASELEAELGMEAFESKYAAEATKLQETIRTNYWNETRGLFMDTFGEEGFVSQHANTLAILTGTIRGKAASVLAEKIASDEDLARASIYFRYYLHLAMTKAGKGDEYLSWLDKWRENMELGLTTWAEKSEVQSSRSDCHAWGSSPNIEFFRIVLGIDTAAPSFAKVRIEPHLGELKKASGSIPHPKGTLSVAYSVSNDGMEVMIELPAGVDGIFVWEGETSNLVEGVNQFRF